MREIEKKVWNCFTNTSRNILVGRGKGSVGNGKIVLSLGCALKW